MKSIELMTAGFWIQPWISILSFATSFISGSVARPTNTTRTVSRSSKRSSFILGEDRLGKYLVLKKRFSKYEVVLSPLPRYVKLLGMGSKK